MTPDEQFQRMSDRVEELAEQVRYLVMLHTEFERRGNDAVIRIAEAIDRLAGIAGDLKTQLNSLGGIQ